MALTQINVGTVANDNTGDPIRTAFQAVNANSVLTDAGGLIESNIVVPGNEATPTAANLNGITTSVDNADITVKANGTGQIILDSTVTRLVTTLSTPATNAGIAGDTVGDVAIDATYVYICVRDFDAGADAWLRSAIFTTF